MHLTATIRRPLLPLLLSALLLLTAAPIGAEAVAGTTLPDPILFVTQLPIPADFATIGSVFANHLGDIDTVGRGGDLYLRYPDGTLRNLTAEAGFGNSGFQGANAIAVRDPSVHWSATRAVFSMVVGAPTAQFQVGTYRWQLYEVSGLGQGQTAVITAVANQPTNYNNVAPVYGTDGRILFISDRPRSGEAHLYPQLDEYESTPTNTGLWSLDPTSGDLRLLDHAPSGNFDPIVDSAGRVIFSRWDHLQRDQQADTDALDGDTYGTFNYADESANAARLDNRDEVFPEPRADRVDLLAGTNITGHRFNHFFPWQIREDGTAAEVLNHLGRHELHFYFNRSFDDDPNLVEFIDSVSGRVNPNSIENLLQIQEDPTTPGTFYGVDAPEFQTHASGRIVTLGAPPALNPDQSVVTFITHPDTVDVVADGGTPSPDHSGHYRDPLPLSDGRLIAAHTAETRRAANEGTRPNPVPRYDFRLRLLSAAGNGYLEAGATLTGGISKNLSYWDPDVLVSYNGPLWELNPVAVRARPAPTAAPDTLGAPEQQVFAAAGVNPTTFQTYLRDNNLAVASVRNATSRDDADRQQPFNLAVPGGGASTIGAAGTIYEVAYMQLFQGDQIRGLGGVVSPRPGRRVLAQVMHDPAVIAHNPPLPGAPDSSVAIAPDGSVAAFMPTRRATAWHLTDLAGTPVVRERYWLTFQPGEIRTCDGCHGINTVNQANGGAATNAPQALGLLLEHWKTQIGAIFSDGFETGDLSAWSSVVP